MMLWPSYIGGALATLGLKYLRYIVTAKRGGRSVWSASLEWFFEKSIENAFSWVATIGFVWCVGVIYIDRIDFFFEWLAGVPLHPAFALLLGAICEYAAPNAIKWLLAKFPGGGQ